MDKIPALMARFERSASSRVISLAWLASFSSCTNTSKKSVPGDPRPGAGVYYCPAGGACTAGVGEILAQLTIEVNSQAKYLGNKKPAGAWPGKVIRTIDSCA